MVKKTDEITNLHCGKAHSFPSCQRYRIQIFIAQIEDLCQNFGSRIFHPPAVPPALSHPGTSPSWTIPSDISPRVISPHGHFPHGTSPPTFFRFVGRFAHVRIGDSNRNRFASTAYFAQSRTTLFPCILLMGGSVRGEVPGGESAGGIARG